jgi:RND family efflux transporter MFP subunit
MSSTPNAPGPQHGPQHGEPGHEGPTGPSAPHEPSDAHEHGSTGALAPALYVPAASTLTRRVALAVGLLAAGGLGLAIATRTKEAKHDKAMLEETQATAVRNAQAEADKPLATVLPKKERKRPEVPVSGTLAPIQEVDVAFKMGGKLSSLEVIVGQKVDKSQKLATLEATEAAAQAAAARAGVRLAEVNLSMARDGQKRSDQLFASGSVSDLEKTQAGLRTNMAEAQLEQARAQAQLASVSLGNAVLTAPFGGVLTRVPTGIGRIVGPGEPLFHLEDLATLKLTGTISEEEASLVETGAEIVVSGVKGKVLAILPSLDAATRRVPIVAELPNGDGKLLARAFVKGTIRGAREIDVFRLPGTALRPGSQDELVVLEGELVRIKRVSFEVDRDGSLLVHRGVDEASRVVEKPSAEVKDGAPAKKGSAASAPSTAPASPSAAPSGAP